SFRDFYAKLKQPATHADWMAYEIQALGKDHAVYTAMLLKTWNLPPRIVSAVSYSHTPQQLPVGSEEANFARCVALGSDLDEAVFAPDRASTVVALAQRAQTLLQLSGEQFTEVVSHVLTLIPETEALYETSILATEDSENLLAEARELLAVRNLQALQEVSAL